VDDHTDSHSASDLDDRWMSYREHGLARGISRASAARLAHRHAGAAVPTMTALSGCLSHTGRIRQPIDIRWMSNRECGTTFGASARSAALVCHRGN